MKNRGRMIGYLIWMTAFLLAEGGLYAVILIREAVGPDEVALRFISVAVAWFFAVEQLFFRRKAEQVFLILAMTFTVVSDVFLVLLDDHYELAVGVFFLAQCLHGARILIGSKQKLVPSVLVRVGLSGIALLVLVFCRFWALLTVLGVLYAVEILLNFVNSGIAIRKEKRFILSFIGFFLFLLCDVTVGLNGIGQSLGVPASVRSALSDLTWVFYLPSQVLIVLSALPWLRKKTEGNAEQTEESETDPEQAGETGTDPEPAKKTGAYPGTEM